MKQNVCKVLNKFKHGKYLVVHVLNEIIVIKKIESRWRTSKGHNLEKYLMKLFTIVLLMIDYTCI